MLGGSDPGSFALRHFAGRKVRFIILRSLSNRGESIDTRQVTDAIAQGDGGRVRGTAGEGPYAQGA